MRIYDLIETKKRGGALTEEEIAYMVRGFVDGRIPDYQMSAMLMAIYFQGMNDREITYLTLEMAHSGDMVDLSPIEELRWISTVPAVWETRRRWLLAPWWRPWASRWPR